MGVYLGPAEFEEPERTVIDAALQDRGLQPMNWDTTAPFVFEEKLSGTSKGDQSLDKWLRKVVRARAHEIPAFYVDLWLPRDFEGMIDFDLPGTYQPTLSAISSPRLLDTLRPVASYISLPDVRIPNGDNLSILLWFEDEAGDTPEKGRWRKNLEAARLLAQYIRAAEYSVANDVGISYF